ncbi:hypothetical protein FRC05_001067 [Tulasnella sp. 425]|nr:hypothetical protein FRC05_001067 [Tulasnella sp. 425]
MFPRFHPSVPVNQLTGIVSPDVPASGSLDSKLKKGPRPIVQSPSLPDGWEEDVSPGGQLVYSKLIDSRGCQIRVNTDFALRLTKNHSAIDQAVKKLSNLANACDELESDAAFKRDVIEACILVPEHRKTQDEFGYYLVNHQDRTIFWLEEIDLEEMGLKAHDADILRLKLEALYWRHVTDFPCRCSLSAKVWEELARCSFLVPLIKSSVTIQRRCEMQPHFHALKGSGGKLKVKETQIVIDPFAIGYEVRPFTSRFDMGRQLSCCILRSPSARLWYDIIAPRAHNYWGTDYARIERTTKLQDDENPSENAGPWLIQWLCTFLLWNEPAVTLKLLDEAWPGGIIYPKQWQSTMEEFSNEWEKILVLSAIIFAGAMAFLAVPIPGQSDSHHQSSCHLDSSVRDYGGKFKDDVHEVSKYLHSLDDGILEYLQWGIGVSLPRALFQWAVSDDTLHPPTVSFCFGVVILAFQLHQDRVNFFYAEVSISAALALGIVAVRGVSPERIRGFRFRRALKYVEQEIAGAEDKNLKQDQEAEEKRWRRASTLPVPGVPLASAGSGIGAPAASSL